MAAGELEISWGCCDRLLTISPDFAEDGTASDPTLPDGDDNFLGCRYKWNPGSRTSRLSALLGLGLIFMHQETILSKLHVGFI